MIGKTQYNCTQMISAVCIICTVMHGTQMTFICIYIWLNIPVRGKVVIGANSVVPEKSLGAILSCL